jgi:mRNA-degrading endonuclease RelE of RelBE toxin-antitoxin system
MQFKRSFNINQRNELAIESNYANEFDEWQLRVGKFRVLYNVHEQESKVSIEALGSRFGNVLFVRGEERKL